MTKTVTIIGAGLAGSEAAWQVAKRGLAVRLYEMRPQKMTPAHHTGDFAELVCSNSLRGVQLENAVGLLKEEMRRLDSLIIRSAELNRVPAGGALAVDRQRFAFWITEKIKNHPLIEIINEEVTELPESRPLIIATGPLPSQALAEKIKEITGETELYFYDSAAPIVTKESIDFTKVFCASRYGKGTADYLNCPLNEK
jgi:methylenetetrahydrofolate--tRNA-(uracil-5-)-methyltransferase